MRISLPVNQTHFYHQQVSPFPMTPEDGMLLQSSISH